MTGAGKTIVIYQGSKFYWRTRNSVDVTIVQHKDAKVTEVVCYEPSIDVESSRVYLDSAILDKRIDHTQIEEKLSFAKRNNVPHTEKLLNDIVHRAMADYILNRLFQTEYSVEPKKFEVAFQLNFRDVIIEAGDKSTERLICGPPSELTPFPTCHKKIFTECQKDEALKALEDAKQNLLEHCHTAMSLQAQPVLPLGFKERWRIPIVLGKLAHNRMLSEEDGKIWDTVASKLKTQEDIDRITSVTLRTVVLEPVPAPAPPAPKMAFGFGKYFFPAKRASASALSPSQTPVRSPCATPPRTAVSPRRSSTRRIMADTVNSQRRAISCAEDNNTPKKKATSSKKKGLVRRPTPRHRHKSAGAEAAADNSETSFTSDAHTPVFVPPAPSADETSSFVSQLVAALTFTLSGQSKKVSPLLAEEDGPTIALFSQRGSAKNDDRAALSPSHTHSQDAVGVSEQRRHLGELNPHLFATFSTAPSLKAEYAHLTSKESTPVPSAGAGVLERGATAEFSGKYSVREEPAPQARKRRSYLGSFLAVFTGAVEPSGFDSAADLSVKNYPSRRAGTMGFDWLLGGHGQQVVPVDGVECQ